MSKPTPSSNWLESHRPTDFPGLVSFWDFAQRGEDGSWTASAGSSPVSLQEQAGAMSLEGGDDGEAAPFGHALRFEEGRWLAASRTSCPALDFHGPAGLFTVVAWIKRGVKSNGECQFIAGQWNETHLTRQYGMFLDIKTWGGDKQVCGHLSTTGGPTPGYRYCFDGPIGATPIDDERWHCIAMSYDGVQGHVWVDGRLDAEPTLNPYLLPGGLNDGGPSGSDFTVGAVHRHGEPGNFFVGHMAGLAVYDRVLSPAEMWALAQPG